MNIEESVEYLKNCLNDEYNFKNATRKKDKEAIETLLTAYEKEKEKNSKLLEALDTVNHEKGVFIESYEKEKEKNKELSNSYDILAKECNEENRRCMLLAVENQDLKEKNKKLNILRLELIISQLPDTTETYKKYKKELDELLKEE